MAKAKKTIINRVVNCQTMTWGQVQVLECNKLKDAEKRLLGKLKKAILDQGFSFPLFIWSGEDYIIDGAGRVEALKQLEREGYAICDLPVVYIEAETREEAKKLVLLASSEYGPVTADTFALFCADLGDVAELTSMVSIDNSVFSTEVLGRLPAEPEKSSKGKKGRRTLEVDPLQPQDLVEIGQHQLTVGYERTYIAGRIVEFVLKEFPDLVVTKNGKPLQGDIL